MYTPETMPEGGRLFQLALEGFDETLGPTHTISLASARNLAGFFLCHLQDARTAVPLLRRVYNGFLNMLGSNHHITIEAKESLDEAVESMMRNPD